MKIILYLSLFGLAELLVLMCDRFKANWPIALAVVVGSLFRQTLMVPALVLLCRERFFWPKPVNWVWFFGTLAASWSVKSLLMLATDAPYSVNSLVLIERNWMLNFDWLIHPRGLQYVLIMTGGMVWLCFLIRWQTHRDRLFKLMLAVFCIGLYFLCPWTDWREWDDVIPLCAIIVIEWLSSIKHEQCP